MSQIKLFIIIIVILILGAFVLAVTSEPRSVSNDSGEYDEFAQCLNDNGAIFYGAFWCPHCNNQKKMFGSSERLLPYVECSLPSGQGQTQECIDEGVESYPTWEYPDGTRDTGEVALEVLAQKTGCSLPGVSTESTMPIEIEEGGSSDASHPAE